MRDKLAAEVCDGNGGRIPVANLAFQLKPTVGPPFSLRLRDACHLSLYEGWNRIAILRSGGNVVETYLFDGVDQPLRIHRPADAGATPPVPEVSAYYELNIAGNVRRLRGTAGEDLGGYPTKLESPEYAASFDTRRVDFHGARKWKGKRMFLSESLAHEPVGVEPSGGGCWRVWYGPVYLGAIVEGVDAIHFVRPRREPRKRPPKAAEPSPMSPV